MTDSIPDTQPVMTTHRFTDAKIPHLQGVSKSMVSYDGKTHESYKDFMVKLESCVGKLAIQGNCRTWEPNSFQNILDGVDRFHVDTEKLLVFIFSDFLTGDAEELTRSIRKGPPEGRFRAICSKLSERWGTEYVHALGAEAMKTLMRLKYSNGPIREYNQNFATVFESVKRYGRMEDGLGIVDIYLNSLPTENPIMISALSSIRNHRSSLFSAMSHIAGVVGDCTMDGCLIRTPHPSTFAVVRQPRKQNQRRNQRNNGRRCDHCNGSSCQGGTSCFAYGKNCNYCGKLNHFEPCCKTKKRDIKNGQLRSRTNSNSNSQPTSSPTVALVQQPTTLPTVNSTHSPTNSTSTPNTQQNINIGYGFAFHQMQSHLADCIGIDSCAYHSILPSKDYFTQLTPHTELVKGISPDFTSITGSGKGRLTLQTMHGNDHILHLDAHLLESVPMPLLSMKQLKTLGWNFDLNSEQMTMSLGEVVVPLTFVGNLLVTRRNTQLVLTVSPTTPSLVHHRFAHPGITTMKAILESTGSHYDDSDIEKVTSTCGPCAVSKLVHHTPTRRVTPVAPGTFYLDFMEFSTEGFQHFKHALVLVDGNSRTTHVSCTLNRSTEEVIRVISRSRAVIKRLVLDNAKSFIGEAFLNYCSTQKIVVDPVPPDAHEFMGKVERLIRTLRSMTIAMLETADLPLLLWPFAVTYAAYLKNRIPHASLENLSPYKVETGNDPDLSHIRVFGCTVYYKVLGDTGPKEARVERGIFMGYNPHAIFGTALILTEKKTIISRHYLNMIFHENVFKSSWNREKLIETVLAAVSSSDPPEPEFFHHISTRKDKKDWYDAIKVEIDTILKNGTLTVEDVNSVPDNVQVIPSRFVFKKKRDGQSKARLVAGGHKQIELQISSSSPTTSISTILLLLHIAQSKKYQVITFDFDAAYLNSDLKSPIWMNLPPGWPNRHGKVAKVVKSLYGLKEASNYWYTLLSKTLGELGLTQSSSDPCLFFNLDRQIFLAIYVDDVLAVTYHDNPHWNNFFIQLSESFPLKLTPPTAFLGFNISREADSIKLSVSGYIQKLLTKLGLADCNPALTPLPTKYQLSLTGSAPENPPFEYRSVLGALNWISRLRPDLVHALSQLARATQCPNEMAYSAMKRLLRYLKGTTNFSLNFKSSSNELWAVTDADFAGNVDTRQSTGCSMIFIGDNLIHWYAKLHRTVATSSCEAEFLEHSRCAKHIMYYRALLEELGMKQPPTTIYTDSASAMALERANTTPLKSKHFATHLHFVRSLIADNILEIAKIPTEFNVADLGTKALPKPQFVKLRSYLQGEDKHLTLRGHVTDVVRQPDVSTYDVTDIDM
jgi:hypothetical protein